MSHAPRQIWWSAAELAEAALPDLPGTKRRVNDLVRREGWQNVPSKARRRKGRGGGWEYHWELLPARARAKLMVNEVTKEPEPDRSREAAWAEFETLANSSTQKARERVAILKAVEALIAGGMTRDMATAEIATINGVSPRTIWNWAELVRGVPADDWLAYVAPRYHRTSGAVATVVEPEFAERLKSDYLRLAQPSFRSCYDRTKRWAEDNGVACPPLHTARRWYKRTTSKAMETLGRKGMEALKRLYPAQIRDRSKLHALEGVNGDYHRFDVFVNMQTPDGIRVVRPQMVAFQDLFSGKILAWRLSYSANSQTVQLCLGDLIEEWGIPKHVLLDNGREFAAKLITGGTKTRFRFKVTEEDIPGLLTTLGCEVHWATPYSGQSKPIERAFRDLCDRVARHPACEGAYTGNRPDAKPENWGSRVMEQAEFEELVAVELAAHNARQDRRTAVAYDRSFDDVFAESYQRAPIRRATPEQRRLWLMGAQGVTVGRLNGRISFMGNAYFDEFLHEHLGQKVVARFDDAALWEGLHIYALTGEYLGYAACQEATGFFDVNGAKEIKRARTNFAKATRAQLEEHRKLKAAEVAAGAIAATPPAPPRPAAQVVEIPKPHKRAAKPAPRTAEEQRPLAEIVTSMTTKRPRRANPTDERDRYAEARKLERQLDQGEALTSDQARWLRAYQTTPEYRAQQTVERHQRDHKGG